MASLGQLTEEMAWKFRLQLDQTTLAGSPSRLQLLARLTLNSGKHTANQPTRLAHPGFLCRRSRGLGEMTPRTPRVKLFGEVATCLVPGFQVRNPPAR